MKELLEKHELEAVVGGATAAEYGILIDLLSVNGILDEWAAVATFIYDTFGQEALDAFIDLSVQIVSDLNAAGTVQG